MVFQKGIPWFCWFDFLGFIRVVEPIIETFLLSLQNP